MERARLTPEQIVSKRREAGAMLAAGRPVAQRLCSTERERGDTRPLACDGPLRERDRAVPR